jgi:hypothetical protein
MIDYELLKTHMESIIDPSMGLDLLSMDNIINNARETDKGILVTIPSKANFLFDKITYELLSAGGGAKQPTPETELLKNKW